LEKVGGFDEGLSQGEDKDLCRRVIGLGNKVSYVGGVNWYRRKPSTYREFLRKEYNVGKRRIFYDSKYDDYSTVLRSLLPLMAVGVLLSLVAFFGIALAGITLIAGLTFFILRFNMRVEASGSNKVTLPLVALSARFASSIGTIYGLAVFVAIMAVIMHVDLGKF
jgi:GT2 family glycosyltransferase